KLTTSSMTYSEHPAMFNSLQKTSRSVCGSNGDAGGLFMNNSSCPKRLYVLSDKLNNKQTICFCCYFFILYFFGNFSPCLMKEVLEILLMIFPLIYVCVCKLLYGNESRPVKYSHVQKIHIVANMRIL
ncbi:hypothetical protein EJD97_017080, partial [Solanum chilense]